MEHPFLACRHELQPEILFTAGIASSDLLSSAILFADGAPMRAWPALRLSLWIAFATFLAAAVVFGHGVPMCDLLVPMCDLLVRFFSTWIAFAADAGGVDLEDFPVMRRRPEMGLVLAAGTLTKVGQKESGCWRPLTT